MDTKFKLAKKLLPFVLLGSLFSCKKETIEIVAEETIDSVAVESAESVVEGAVESVVEDVVDIEEVETFTNSKEPISYEQAEIENTSYTWKRFLEENPNHPKRNEISEKIIRLEVDEILRDTETGMMPSFDNHSSKYSSTSSVKISNDTGCGLTVRYSGTEAKMLDIPNGSTKTISLKSGNYKITASACGYNYAGIENLHGDYSSTFYISRTRY